MMVSFIINDSSSSAKVQFDSHESACAAVENPPRGINVSFDKRINSIKNNFGGKNGGHSFRINTRTNPGMAESRDEVGQYQVS